MKHLKHLIHLLVLELQQFLICPLSHRHHLLVLDIAKLSDELHQCGSLVSPLRAEHQSAVSPFLDGLREVPKHFFVAQNDCSTGKAGDGFQASESAGIAEQVEYGGEKERWGVILIALYNFEGHIEDHPLVFSWNNKVLKHFFDFLSNSDQMIVGELFVWVVVGDNDIEERLQFGVFPVVVGSVEGADDFTQF